MADEQGIVQNRPPNSDRPGAPASSRLKRSLPPVLKGILRRQADRLFSTAEARAYREWLSQRRRRLEAEFRGPLQPGLLSIITPVWNGSAVSHLNILARSIVEQNRGGACEWVILDNGCSKPYLLHTLQQLARHDWVKLIPLPANIGITKGLRRCLEAASGRYVVPVDADDLLHPWALRVVTARVTAAGFPPLLYSDEDKVIGTKFYQPYMKPDWDPVLLLNSAYIAHLGVVDRGAAMELGAYSDAAVEASPDWDLFVRFLAARCTAVHIPEVLYSWRVHAGSTADDAANKAHVHSSQRAVLQRFLNETGHAHNFSVELSPLLGGASHWTLVRNAGAPLDYITVILDESAARAEARSLVSVAEQLAERDAWLHLVGQDVRIDNSRWFDEAAGIAELHPDTVMIGGRIRNGRGSVIQAGQYFGFAGACGDPNRGRASDDPGYFGQMWKQRSVSAVATQFAVIKARFLLATLRTAPSEASEAFLGAWVGAHALRTGKRIVYSPFLSGTSEVDWDALAPRAEQILFAKVNADIIPDRRFYSHNLSLRAPFRLSEPEAR